MRHAQGSQSGLNGVTCGARASCLHAETEAGKFAYLAQQEQMDTTA